MPALGFEVNKSNVPISPVSNHSNGSSTQTHGRNGTWRELCGVLANKALCLRRWKKGDSPTIHLHLLEDNMVEIPLWVKLLDLLTALADIKQRRRREVFEHMLVPIHTLLGDIHRDYLALFESMKAACPIRSSKQAWEYERNGERVVAPRRPDVSKILAHAKKEYKTRRLRLEPDRIDVRARATTILNARVAKEEKRYLWGVLSYLLYPTEAIGSPREIDMETKFVLFKGANQALDTPSSLLLEKIDPVTDADEVFELVDECEGHFKKRWAEVTALWTAAQLAVFRSTTPLK